MENSSKVFIIGLSKTGTTSLNKALEILGYKTRHYDFMPFEKIITQDFNQEDLSHDAISDITVVSCYKKLDKVFPNSKFILTTRDTKSWLASCKRNFPESIMNKYSGEPQEEIFKKVYGCVFYNEYKFTDTLHKHIYGVMDYFKSRPNDLLIMNIFEGDGWEKLCGFLGKEIPDAEFPHISQSALMYNEDYFERGIELGISGYTNYRWIPELTIPMCARMCEYLQISDDDKILDFGSAKGFVVRGFRLLHKQCWGYDISEYALNNAPHEIKKYLSNNLNEFGDFTWVIAKDVLEHVDYEDIDHIIKELSKITKKMFAIIPMGNEGKYFVPVYEMDITHLIREDLDWWQEKFEKNGFKISEARYNMKYIKQNYEKWEKGNGFFILESK